LKEPQPKASTQSASIMETFYDETKISTKLNKATFDGKNIPRENNEMEEFSASNHFKSKSKKPENTKKQTTSTNEIVDQKNGKNILRKLSSSKTKQIDEEEEEKVAEKRVSTYFSPILKEKSLAFQELLKNPSIIKREEIKIESFQHNRINRTKGNKTKN
jgi:hypothetical protein